MVDYQKPLPEITDATRPFWTACRNQELRVQRCNSCGHLRYPIAHVCPECLGEQCTWTALSGEGTVFSYIVFHQVYHPAFTQDVPYNVALIQLTEGPRIFSNVVGCANHDVRVGDRVAVVFDPVTDTVTIPRFKKV